MTQKTAAEAAPEGPSTHAGCIAIGDAGILVRGGPGTGKSSFILSLMLDAPRCLPLAELVADDRVLLRRDGDRLYAAPPPVLAGLVEVRGLGVRRFPYRAGVHLTHLVELGACGPRMPDAALVEFDGIWLRQIVAEDAARAILMLAAALRSVDHAA